MNPQGFLGVNKHVLRNQRGTFESMTLVRIGLTAEYSHSC